VNPAPPLINTVKCLRLNGSAPEPLSFTIADPARIAVDLPETALALSSRRQEINLGPLTTILAAEANGRTRIVLNLSALTPYETRVSGDSVYIELGGDAAAATFAAQPSSSAAQPRPATATARSINNIDFRRGPDGAGQVLVELSDPSTTVDVRQEGGRIVIDFANTALPTELLRRLDVTDFATPVATVDAIRSDRTARLVVTASGNYEQLAYQADNVFTLELKVPPEAEARCQPRAPLGRWPSRPGQRRRTYRPCSSEDRRASRAAHWRQRAPSAGPAGAALHAVAARLPAAPGC
jgi:type IV pilus assembly protein PilQ